MMFFPLQQIPPEITEIIQNNYGSISLVFGLYILTFLSITVAARSKGVGDLSDYSVASRNLGIVITTLTLFATINSGVGMLGFPGTIYGAGVSFTVMTFVGYSLGSFLIWYFGRRIWLLGKKYSYRTPGDLLGDYYQSDTMRFYTILISASFNIVYAVAQLTAGGILINVLTGGIVSQTEGIVIIAIIIAIHTIVSGVRGIAWLDTLNGSIMIVMLTILVAYIYVDGGGFTNIFASLGNIETAFITSPGPGGAFPTTNMYGTGIGFLLSLSVMTPAAWLRFYATEKQENFVRLGAGILIIFVLVNFAILWIGTYGRVLFPTIENPDYVSSLVAFELLPIPIAGLFLIAILAGIISTTDSYIHALSVTTSRDLFSAIIIENMTERQELIVNYVIVVITGVVAIVIALFYQGLIVPVAVFGSGIALHMLPATFGAVSWPRASNEAALIATPIGLILSFTWELGVINNPLSQYGLRGLFIAFIINLLLFIVISYVTSPPSQEKVEKHHKFLMENL